MTNLEEAARMALEALEYPIVGLRTKAVEALRAALAEQEAAPPRGPDDDLMAELQAARAEATFYRRRCEALQQWQSHMRDPERTVVCDILANGSTLPDAIAGDRYKLCPGDEVVIRSRRDPAAEREGLTEEQIFAALPSGIMDCLMDPWDCGTGDRSESIRRDIVRIARAIESEVRK